MKDPPASAFPGRVYRSVGERCAACMMRGGDEPPCLPDGLLREIQEKHGRPCPRVELAPQNGLAAQLVSFLVDERLRPVAPDLLRSRARWMTAAARTLLLVRVARALQDRVVSEAMYPWLTSKKGSR